METDAKKWLESLSRMKPNFDRFSSVPLSGIHVFSADHGRVVCSFRIPSYLTVHLHILSQFFFISYHLLFIFIGTFKFLSLIQHPHIKKIFKMKSDQYEVL